MEPVVVVVVVVVGGSSSIFFLILGVKLEWYFLVHRPLFWRIVPAPNDGW
jgi:hypothetical protein